MCGTGTPNKTYYCCLQVHVCLTVAAEKMSGVYKTQLSIRNKLCLQIAVLPTITTDSRQRQPGHAP